MKVFIKVCEENSTERLNRHKKKNFFFLCGANDSAAENNLANAIIEQ